MASKASLHYDEKARVETKQWLENWKVAGPILDAERIARLRQLDEAAAARIALDLWSMARVGSGDSGEGLKPMKDALRRLSRQR